MLKIGPGHIAASASFGISATPKRGRELGTVDLFGDAAAAGCCALVTATTRSTRSRATPGVFQDSSSVSSPIDRLGGVHVTPTSEITGWSTITW